MLPAPKGLKYWIDGPNGPELVSNAPEWAKKEFCEYMAEMKVKTTKDGKINKL